MPIAEDVAKSFDQAVQAEREDLERSLFHSACVGDSETAVTLIESGADVNARDGFGSDWTPLIHAAKQGHTAMVNVLIEHGANVNERDRDGWTALHQAAFFGQTETVFALIARGADANITDSDGFTAHERAEWRKHPKTAFALQTAAQAQKLKSIAAWRQKRCP